MFGGRRAVQRDIGRKLAGNQPVNAHMARAIQRSYQRLTQ
jgi:hypothetical protein